MKKILVGLIVLSQVLVMHAQKKDLGFEQLIKSNFTEVGITQAMPTFIAWISDFEFTYKKEGKVYLYNCKKNSSKEYVDTAPIPKTLPPTTAFIKANDIYLRKDGIETQLTFDKEKKQNATLSPSNEFIAFTKNNNLYTIHIDSKKSNQLTTDGSDVILNGYLSWVYMEEVIGRQSNYKGFWWSPDSKSIAYFKSDDSKVPTFTITDADGAHGVVETQRYPKSGDANPSVKIGFVSPNGGTTTWADYNVNDDQYFGQPNWTPDGAALWVNWMNRANNHLIIHAVNPSTGSKQQIYEEKQNTWIDLDDNDRVTFLKNNKGFLLLSDRTGWKHIYHYDMSGKLVNTITSGNYTVLNIDKIDEAKQVLTFTARGKENTATRDLYTINWDGKNLKRLTAGDFMHAANPSPNSNYSVTTYSNATTPTSIGVVDVKKGTLTNLGTTKGANYDAYNIAKTELIRVKSDDGKYDLPLKITWPLNYDKSKKYPVLISIYGGPDAGTVWDTWSLSGTQQWYAKEGLIQVAMDHRASGHFGKQGVELMHRNLGYWEMVDYRTMTKWLIANASVDPKRICMTGFSYGGYMSCYAVTHSADLFTHAMAGGAVTDWSLYDSHYTEKLMDTPKENPEGYKTSSVFTYLKNYTGGLQLVHGAIDDNVHQQNSIQLLAKLQDLKKDVEFMTYSGGRHGWRYLSARNAHFENLKIKFIYKNLLQKEVPQEFLK